LNIDKVKPFHPPAVADEQPGPVENDEYEVEKILRKRTHKGALQYLVRWKGWGAKFDSWLPLEELDHAQEVLEAFENSLPKTRSSSRGGGKVS
jgi:hypothetical protein